jgi:hypothetical protein
MQFVESNLFDVFIQICLVLSSSVFDAIMISDPQIEKV